MIIYLLGFTGHYAEDGYRIGDKVWTDLDALRADLTERGYVRIYSETEILPERWYNSARGETPGNITVFAEIIKRKVDA